MAITPNTAFTQGQQFSANQANRFPRGIMAGQTLQTTFTTSATHTTYQDSGATVTITEQIGRIYRVVMMAPVYPSGGLQAMKFRFVRGSTAINDFLIPSAALDAANGYPAHLTFVYTSASSGSQTWKVQVCAVTANTAVSIFGDATFQRQFWIEDIGES